MTSKQRSPGNQTRGDVRVIDRLLETIPHRAWGLRSDNVMRLKTLWPEIDRKYQKMGWDNFEVPYGSERYPRDDLFSEEEITVMVEIVAGLLGPVDTDSRRRRERDALVADDYIYHKEFLLRSHVTEGVRKRWGLSKSAVEQAVKRHGEDARSRIEVNLRTFRHLEKVLGATSEELMIQSIESIAAASRKMRPPRRNRQGA